MKLLYLYKFFSTRHKPAVQENENLFSLLLENNNEIIVMIDAAQNVIYRSPSATRISGWTDEDVKQPGILHHTTHPDDLQKLDGYIKEVLQHPGKTVNTFLRTLHKDGHYMYMEGSVRNLLHDKNVAAIIFNVRNVTDHVLREQELVHSRERIIEREQQLQLYVEHSPAAIAMFDNELRHIVVSRRWLADYNLAGKDVIGKTLEEVFPGLPQKWKDIYQRSLTGAVEKNEEDAIERGDGSITFLRWEIRPWYTAAGTIGGAITFTENITERKKAEAKIAADEEKYRQLLESISDGFIALDTAWNIVYTNSQSQRFFGHSAEYLRGKNIWEVFPNAVNGPFHRAYKQAMETQQHVQFIDFSPYSNLWLQTNVYPSPAGLTVYFTDITELKKLEQNLQEQQQKEQLRVTAAIIEAEEKERNIIGEELHDNVNQILTGIFLQLSRVKSQQQEAGSIVDTSMQYLKKAIDENRKISKELIIPEFVTVPLLTQLESLVEYMLGDTGCKININTGGCKEEMLSEKQKLIAYRVLQEQCTNITKYAHADTVSFLLTTDDNLFKMMIADNGVGMDAAAVTNGIGLRNIKSRLSLVNGAVHITTSPGNGFIMEVVFPVNS
jgi:PAS domain S-box-containing protein